MPKPSMRGKLEGVHVQHFHGADTLSRCTDKSSGIPGESRPHHHTRQATGRKGKITMTYTLSVYDPMKGLVFAEEFSALEYAEKQAEYLFSRFGYECHVSALISTIYGSTKTVQPWDGITPVGGIRYQSYNGGYMMDGDGNIYYERNDGKGLWAFWCDASRLNEHVRHLNRIIPA